MSLGCILSSLTCSILPPTTFPGIWRSISFWALSLGPMNRAFSFEKCRFWSGRNLSGKVPCFGIYSRQSINLHGSAIATSFIVQKSDTKTRVESTLGCCLVEISEMSGLRKAELERVKQDLTSVKDRVRLAYARHVSRIERQFMFVGTSNRRDFLPNDPSGNTRFLPIDCPVGRGSAEEFMAKYREMLGPKPYIVTVQASVRYYPAR